MEAFKAQIGPGLNPAADLLLSLDLWVCLARTSSPPHCATIITDSEMSPVHLTEYPDQGV